MVAELKEVISKVEKLDDEEQKRIAKMLEEEISFDRSLPNNHDQLSSHQRTHLKSQKENTTKNT